MKETLRLGLVQMRCEKADIEANLAAMAGWLSASRARGIDIVAFPEMNVTGYADPTRYPEARLTIEGEEVSQLLDLTRGSTCTVVAGIIEDNPRGKPFITQLVIRDGRLLGTYRKRTIAEDEADWFSPGEDPLVCDHDGLPYGIAICADIDNETVFEDCVNLGARIVLECAAPGLYGEQSTRNWQSGFDWWRGKCIDTLAPYASRSGTWIAVATQAGRTRDEDFPGGAFLFSPAGAVAFSSTGGAERATFLEIDFAGGTAREI